MVESWHQRYQGRVGIPFMKSPELGTECSLSGWLMQWLNPGLSGGFPGGWLTLVALWPWESLCTQIPAHAVDRQGTLYVPKQAWLSCHTRFYTGVLAVPREVTHLSLSSLPVALEQFMLAVRHCPDREDQALLMKVGYQISPYFLKASLHSDCPEESSVFHVRELDLSSLNFVLRGDMPVSGWREGGWLMSTTAVCGTQTWQESGCRRLAGAYAILGGFGWFYLNLSDSLDSYSRFMRLGQIPCLRLYFLIKIKDPTPSQLAPSSLSPPEGTPHKLDLSCQPPRWSAHVVGSLSLSQNKLSFFSTTITLFPPRWLGQRWGLTYI